MLSISADAAAAAVGSRRWLGVVILSIAVCCRVTSSLSSSVAVTDASWDRDSVAARRGDNLTLTCRLTLGDNLGGLVGGRPVFRVVHSHADRTLLVSDNGNLTAAFARLGRYDVTYLPPSDDATVRAVSVIITIIGVRGEDSGTLACQQLNNDEYIGYCDINVYVDVDDLYAAAISSTGDITRVPDGSDVILRETNDTRATTGVGCVAVIEGGGSLSTAPRVSVFVVVSGSDEVDATSWFQTSTDSTRTVMDSGLSVYRFATTARFVADRPDVELNGRLMRCIARAEGFESGDERRRHGATARLVVHYVPVIWCVASNLSATVGSNATFNCMIKSNPASEITWSAVVGTDEQYDVSSDVSVSFDSKAVSEDQVDITLSVTDVHDRHFRLYTIQAVNAIGDSTSTVKLVRRRADFTVAQSTSTSLAVAETEPMTSPEPTMTSPKPSAAAVVPTTTTAAVHSVSVSTTRLEPESESEPVSELEPEPEPDRQSAMQNDAAVVLGDEEDQPTSSPIELVPSPSVVVMTTTIAVDKPAPVRAEKVEVAISSAGGIHCTLCFTYLCRLLLACSVVRVIRRLNFDVGDIVQ